MLSTRLRLSLPLLFLLMLGNTSSAETLIEKEKSNKDLTAVELTAIFRAEVRWCENKSPEFKKQAGELIAKFESNPKYEKVARDQNFIKLKPEADAFVFDLRNGSDIKHTCDRELDRLKNVRF